jgi:hypothetical protein
MLDCYFKKHFFIDCPGCGMQRAFNSLIHGEFFNSITFNAALIPLIITFSLLLLQLFLKHQLGGKLILVSFSTTAFIMLFQLILKFIYNF